MYNVPERKGEKKQVDLYQICILCYNGYTIIPPLKMSIEQSRTI